MSERCANCGIEIRWQPTVVDGRAYCCVGCSHGGPCSCDYGNLPSSVGRYELVHLRYELTIGHLRGSHRLTRRHS
jgi:hypothetical protein